MFSLFFKPRINPIILAEEMGYDVGWLGLENINPYRINGPEYTAYNWGYNQAIDDANELNEAHLGCECDEEYWPYNVIH